MQLASPGGSPVFDLAPDRPLVLGRSAACDLPLYEGTISRRHAEVRVGQDDQIQVRDLGSTNGTFINGHRLTGPMIARPGDVVTFGQVPFHLRAVGEEGSTPGTTPVDSGALPAPEEIRRSLPVEEGLSRHLTATESSENLLDLVSESFQERQARRLSLLLEISKELSGQPEVNRLLEKVVTITFQLMNVDRVAVLIREEDDSELTTRVARRRDGAPWDGRGVPRSIAHRAVSERVALLTDNAPTDERFGGESILLHRVQSALAAPLVTGEGRASGLLYVDNQTSPRAFGDEDLEFLTAFASIAAVALENSRLLERTRREAVVLSNFQRYFAPDLARQIAAQEGEVSPGGDKRHVVILFSDVRGFTALSEGMRPDEIATLLNEYFDEMVEIVFEHGGMLDKFIGDAVMAVWGAPITRIDDPDQAMAAALEMQRSLTELNRAWQVQGRPPLSVGIGLHSGEVFAGNIGSNQRLEYTVIGDAVNTASRLCAQAGAREILLSETFYRELRHPPPAEVLDSLKLKGKAATMTVYRVTADEEG